MKTSKPKVKRPSSASSSSSSRNGGLNQAKPESPSSTSSPSNTLPLAQTGMPSSSSIETPNVQPYESAKLESRNATPRQDSELVDMLQLQLEVRKLREENSKLKQDASKVILVRDRVQDLLDRVASREKQLTLEAEGYKQKLLEMHQVNKKLLSELNDSRQKANQNEMMTRTAVSNMRSEMSAIQTSLQQKQLTSLSAIGRMEALLQMIVREADGNDVFRGMIAEIQNLLEALKFANRSGNPSNQDNAFKLGNGSNIDGATLMEKTCADLQKENHNLLMQKKQLENDLKNAKSQADAVSFIPQYRVALVKARTLAASLNERLLSEAKSCDQLRKEIAQLRIRQSELEAESKQNADAARELESVETQYEREISALQEHVSFWQALSEDREQWAKELEEVNRAYQLEFEKIQHEGWMGSPPSMPIPSPTHVPIAASSMSWKSSSSSPARRKSKGSVTNAVSEKRNSFQKLKSPSRSPSRKASKPDKDLSFIGMNADVSIQELSTSSQLNGVADESFLQLRRDLEKMDAEISQLQACLDDIPTSGIAS